MMSQTSEVCADWNGLKYQNAVVSETTNVEVFVAKFRKIVLEGRGNQLPGETAEDVVVIVKQLDHHVFKRNEADLEINRTISFVEALCGVNF